MTLDLWGGRYAKEREVLNLPPGCCWAWLCFSYTIVVFWFRLAKRKKKVRKKKYYFCLVAHKTCTNKTFMCVKLPNWSQGWNSQGAEYWAKERNETAELLHWETYVVHLHIYQHSNFWYVAALLKIMNVVVWCCTRAAGPILASQTNYTELQWSL